MRQQLGSCIVLVLVDFRNFEICFLGHRDELKVKLTASLQVAKSAPSIGPATHPRRNKMGCEEKQVRREWKTGRAPQAKLIQARLLTDISIKEASRSSLTPQALYGRASNAGPPRDTCRPGPNPKPTNRALTWAFRRGAGRA